MASLPTTTLISMWSIPLAVLDAPIAKYDISWGSEPLIFRV
jgi:hypothetical protein